MIDLKAVAAGTFISAGLALAAAGVSTGVANAAPAAPVIAGPQYVAENGPGRGPRLAHVVDWWWPAGAPRRWDPVDACIGVQGPFGYVQGSACI